MSTDSPNGLPAPERLEAARTFLDDPFADWGNDDLHFKPPVPLGQYRDALEKIFAWPELRALFDAYQAAAQPARQRSRRWGIGAVWLGFVALCSASFAPLILELAKKWETTGANAHSSTHSPLASGLGLLILSTSLTSAAIGYGAILRGRQKARWLLNRFWCERLRELHFQFIINNLPLAAQALTETAAMDRYLALRREQLDLFREDYTSSAKDRLEALEKDLSESDPWISQRWEAAPPSPPKSGETDSLLAVLAHQRFGIQKRFCARKLLPGWHSPRTRAHFVTNASNSLTVILLGLSVATGVTYLEAPERSVVLLSLAGFAGMFGACIAAMRVLNEGLQFTVDTERYNWYLASIEALEHRFNKVSLKQKVEALRDMELLAYQEMRRFIIAVSRSKFIM